MSPRLLVPFALLLLVASPPESAAGEWDEGASHNYFFKARVKGDWYVQSIGNLATQRGLNDPFLSYADLTVGTKVLPSWSVDAGYRQLFFDFGDGWQPEFRPLVNLSWRKSTGGWYLLNRSRAEFRMFEDANRNRVRYRNQTLVVAPWELSPLKLKLYAEQEFFYEPDNRGYNLNWLTGGVRYGVTENITLKLAYRWQALKTFNDGWQNRHVLVTGINVILM